MTTLNGLAKRYDVLTIDERFRASLAARLRGDKAEEGRLDRSCPVKAYTMADGAYLDRWRALDDVLGRVVAVLMIYERAHAWRAACAAVAGQLGRLAVELAGLAWLAGWEEASARAGKRDQPMPAGGFGAVFGRYADADVLAALWGDCVAGSVPTIDDDAAALWLAFDAWALAVAGCGGAELLSPLDDVDGGRLVELARAAAAEASPDGARVAEYRTQLDDAWRKHVGAGDS